MTGKDLQSDLPSLFKGYSEMAEKLIKLGSTQNNGSFNNKVSTNNPKAILYSGSESTSFRVAAAMAQKKIGLQIQPRVCVYFLDIRKKVFTEDFFLL